ncbi:hypothetical protein O181_081616 [Austropuccinia psidii MF-1]|uniref:Uncharacterized protein n=1 Tax=Austropuccinia psidii MF-1 TaxID=1389203 RepID=A0A9Q3IG47_9BASI|nr:hypothetical protein [Austropuccinia psidii MF-1]
MYRDNELISSSEQALRPIRYRGSSESLDSNFYQRESITDKTLLEKPKHVIRGSEEAVFPKEEQKPRESSSSLHKCQIQAINPQIPTRRGRKRQRERPSPSGKSLPLIITELQREERQPWTMFSIFQEL